MLEGLQKKWKVNGWRLVLILITFALGGSATGYVGKRIMNFLNLDSAWLYIPIYIIVVTLIWPLMVIIVSIPFGQFKFFRNYIRKLAKRFSGNKKKETLSLLEEEHSKVGIAIFASGTGTNARKIIEHFGSITTSGTLRNDKPPGVVRLIATNKSEAGVLEIAREFGIPTIILEKDRFFRGDAYVKTLKEMGIDFIVLAGFLWKVPAQLIHAYYDRIINIHPALLPKYGGKGFYGQHVHEAVIKAGEKETGITIHYVDEHYDHGNHIFQEKVIIEEGDTPDSIAKKVQVLEHLHFARVIEEAIKKSEVGGPKSE